MRTPARTARGFTLLESMAAAAVAAIVAAMAVPPIEGVVQRARRTDALVAVLAVQLAQERFRSGAPGYGTLAEVGAPAASSQGHYRLAVSDANATGYTLTATATGPQQRDKACRTLRMTVAGADTLYASGPDEAVANNAAANRRCWNW